MPESVSKLRGKTRAELLAVRGHERTSLFIKRGRKIVFVKSGSIFSRKHNNSSRKQPELSVCEPTRLALRMYATRSVSRAGISPAVF